MSKHTPTPWRAARADHGWVVDADGYQIVYAAATRIGSEAQANAEHIARAVNAHEALLAACELTLAHLTSAAHRETKIIPPVLAALRAAIVKATGDKP